MSQREGARGGRARCKLFGMRIEDLQPDEQLALVALTRAIIRADGVVTPEEGKVVAFLGRALGEDVYRRAFTESAHLFPDDAALKEFLQSIVRPEARLFIFDTILDLAVADALSPDELPLLRWVEATWQIAAMSR